MANQWTGIDLRDRANRERVIAALVDRGYLWLDGNGFYHAKDCPEAARCRFPRLAEILNERVALARVTGPGTGLAG